MKDTLKQRTIRGVGWSFGGSLASYGITFVVGIVLARLLSPDEYGLIGIILIIVTIFNTIVDGGFSNALIRKIDANEEDYNTVFFINLIVSTALYFILFLSAPFVASFFRNQQLIPLIRVMGICVIINAFSLIQSTLLVKEINFRSITKCQIISSILSGVIGISMAYMEYGVWSLVGQQISAKLFNTVLLWGARKWYPHFVFSYSSFKELWGFGWKLLVTSLINSVWNELFQVVIGKCYSTQTLGYYTKAREYVSIVSNNLTSVVQRVSYPSLSEIQEDKVRLKRGYKKVIKVTMLVAFVLILGLAACAHNLVLVLIGEKWLPAVPLLQLICFNMMLYPLHATNLNMLQVAGRSDLFLKLEILKKTIAIIPILLGIFVGIYWMLGVSIIVGYISYFLNAYYSGAFLAYGTKEQIKDILPDFGVGVFVSLAVYFIGYLPLNLYFLLVLQIAAGALLTITLCEVLRLEEYLECKSIILGIVRRFRS